MGLLKSIENVPGIDFYEFRDQDYYNKYTYRARLTLLGTRQLMYAKNEAELVKRVNSTSNMYGYEKPERQQVRANLPILVKILEWKIKSQKDKKSTIRLESNTFTVFSNDLSYLKTLEAIDSSLEVNYTEVQKSEFIGVKNFVREPKHKYRVYLKSKKIEKVFISDLKDLLDRTKGLYPSPGLKYWLSNYNINQPSWSWRYRWASSSHFIDYDDESTLSYLSLMQGEMLGKRYKLEKRPEEV